MQSNSFGSYNFDIFLTYIERLGVIIGLLGYLLLFVSAKQAEETLIGQKYGVQSQTGSQAAPKTAVDAMRIRLTAVTILAIVAYIRLKEREQRIESGQETSPITPNINITAGSWITVIGHIVTLTGLKQREREQATVTIL